MLKILSIQYELWYSCFAGDLFLLYKFIPFFIDFERDVTELFDYLEGYLYLFEEESLLNVFKWNDLAK